MGRIGLFVLVLMTMLTWKPALADDGEWRAGVFTPPRAAPQFSLVGSDGKELTLGRYDGRVVLLAFGFTSCTDVCPTTLAVLATALKDLGAASKDVQVVYITVDPENDGAERMRDYLAGFNSTFIGGTGSAEQLEAVRGDYGIMAQSKGVGTAIAHSSCVFLIDRGGRLRALMLFGQSPSDYVHDLRKLLTE